MKLVTEYAGRPVTNSLKVAEVFKKRHDHILRDIRIISTTMKALEKDPPNFGETIYMDTHGRKQPMYVMDRDAFSLLVFGFTGEKAMGFKWDFIKAFNEMELELLRAQTGLIDLSNTPKVLRQIATSMERKLDQKQLLKKKDAPLYQPQVKTPSGMTITKIPKNMETNSVQWQFSCLGLKPRVTTSYLVKKGYLKIVPYKYKKAVIKKEPTKLGKQFFYTWGNGLYIRDVGIAFIKKEIAAGRIPNYCFQKVIA